MQLMSAYNEDVRLSRTELEQVPTPPAQGRFHNPVPFGEFVNLVDTALAGHDLVVESEEHLVGHDGMRYFGILTLSLDGDSLTQSQGWELFLGLRGSHDQSVPRGLALGRSVMVCSNLCFSGDIATLSTKQTTHIWDRLPELVYQATGHIPQLAAREEERVHAMQHFEMKPRWGDAALVEIHRRGALTASQLGKAIREWDQPTYEEHSENGHTAWRLEQAVTEAAKGSGGNMFTVQNRTARASAFINDVIGFE